MTAPAIPSSPAATAKMKANRGRETKPEVELRSQLHRRGLRFRKDFSIKVPDLRVRADIVFPAKRVAVFVDGCFWHGCPEHATQPKANAAFWSSKFAANRRRDEKVNHLLREAGWAVVRVWEHDDPEWAAEAVVRLIRGGTTP